jgi:hypothetical protein
MDWRACGRLGLMIRFRVRRFRSHRGRDYRRVLARNLIRNSRIPTRTPICRHCLGLVVRDCRHYPLILGSGELGVISRLQRLRKSQGVMEPGCYGDTENSNPHTREGV